MKVITEENLTSWRRHLHQNPELSLEEYKTKEFIVSILKDYGIEYQETLETGLVVICKASVETKDTILFRADMPFWIILDSYVRHNLLKCYTVKN